MLNPIEYEITTAVTDFLLGFQALFLIFLIQGWNRSFDKNDSKFSSTKAKYLAWTLALSFLTLAAFFGGVLHFFHWPPDLLEILWHPLYLLLGWTISLFGLAVVTDMIGKLSASLFFLFLGLGALFYSVTLIFPGTFTVFLVYEGIVMLFALFAYVVLSRKRPKRGYGWLALAIVITILAAVLQSIKSIRFSLIWELNYNGLFHLVQMIGLIFLIPGLKPKTPINQV